MKRQSRFSRRLAFATSFLAFVGWVKPGSSEASNQPRTTSRLDLSEGKPCIFAATDAAAAAPRARAIMMPRPTLEPSAPAASPTLGELALAVHTEPALASSHASWTGASVGLEGLDGCETIALGGETYNVSTIQSYRLSA